MSKIGVLGAGTWGTALSRVLCINGHEVSVWSALASEVDEFARTRRHPNLPGMEIPAGIEYTHSLEEVCTGKDIVLFAVPSVYIRSVAAQARPYLPDGQLLLQDLDSLAESLHLDAIVFLLLSLDLGLLFLAE